MANTKKDVKTQYGAESELNVELAVNTEKSNMIPSWENKYKTVEQCDLALERILCELVSFKINGKAVLLPGVNEILNIYSQAKKLITHNISN